MSPRALAPKGVSVVAVAAAFSLIAAIVVGLF